MILRDYPLLHFEFLIEIHSVMWNNRKKEGQKQKRKTEEKKKKKNESNKRHLKLNDYSE